MLQPISGPQTPPKWMAELEKDDIDMLQGMYRYVVSMYYAAMYQCISHIDTLYQCISHIDSYTTVLVI